MNTNALKMLTPDHLDRRTCLKGLSLGAGAVVLQPFVDSLAAEAAGKEPPLRIVFLMQGNGLWPHHVQPKGVDRHKADRLIDLPLADLELPDAISPLAPFKNRLGIIQKLSHKISGGGDHGKKYGALGCFHWRRGPLAQTVDHALASAQSSPIPVVGLGVMGSPEAVFYQQRIGVRSQEAAAHRVPTGDRLPITLRECSGRQRRQGFQLAE